MPEVLEIAKWPIFVLDAKLSTSHLLKDGAQMATLEKRGDYWRAKIRRQGYPIHTRSSDTKAQAERWARNIENDVDGTESEKNTLRDVLSRYYDAFYQGIGGTGQ